VESEGPKSPQPGPSNSSNAERGSLLKSKTPLFENASLKIFVEPKVFERMKRFRLADHHYVMKIIPKKHGKIPLLSSIIDILENSILKILDELKPMYNENDTNLVFITILQNNLISPMRTGGFDLQKSSSAGILQHLMAMFNRFINSNSELKLNNGFSVYFQVFSMDHFHDQKSKRKTHIKATLGCTSVKDLEIEGCCKLLPFAETAFENSCLLTSCLIAYFFNESLLNKSNVFRKLIPLWKEDCFSLPQQMLAVGVLKESLLLMCSKTGINIKGPHSVDTLEQISSYLKSQIHLIKSVQENTANFESYPEKFDSCLPQICLIIVGLNHVVPIINFNKFVNKNRQICFLCGRAFKSFYKHKCTLKEKQCQRCFRPFANNGSILNHPYFTFCTEKLLSVDIITCYICRTVFKSDICFKNHRSLCKQKKKYCPTCKKIIADFRLPHTCQAAAPEYFCNACKEVRHNGVLHFCPFSKQSPSEVWPKLVFFNFMLNVESHVPNLCTISTEVEPGKFHTYHLFDDCNKKIKNQSSLGIYYDQKCLRPAKTNTKRKKLQKTQNASFKL